MEPLDVIDSYAHQPWSRSAADHASRDHAKTREIAFNWTGVAARRRTA